MASPAHAIRLVVSSLDLAAISAFVAVGLFASLCFEIVHPGTLALVSLSAQSP
jgi:hypothetical protein